MKTQRATGVEAARAASWSLVFTLGGAPSELRLEPDHSYTLGRSRTADVHVEDEKASRRHARLFFEGGGLRVEDLGSANGTSVNGARVEAPVTLKDGDTLEIGRAKFKVCGSLPVSPEAQTWWFTKKDVVEAATAPPDRSGQSEQWMSGSLKTVSLMELVQLLSTSQKSATLVLKNKDDCGRLYLRDGQIVAATLNDRPSPQPKKNVYRLLRWKAGRFELMPLDKLPAGPEIDEPASGLLLEGVQLADELDGLAADLPPANARLSLAKPLPVRLRDLPPEELDLVQLALEHSVWLDVLDHFEGTDVDASRGLLSLIQRKIITAS